MPIEIRELHIRASVQDADARPEVIESANSGQQNIHEIIAVCVEQVLQILEKKQER